MDLPIDEWVVALAELSPSDLREVNRQGVDSYCAYGRLDTSFSFLEMIDDNFLQNYFMLAHPELWVQANKVHSELFKLYNMLGEKFDNMVAD